MTECKASSSTTKWCSGEKRDGQMLFVGNDRKGDSLSLQVKSSTNCPEYQSGASLFPSHEGAAVKIFRPFSVLICSLELWDSSHEETITWASTHPFSSSLVFCLTSSFLHFSSKNWIYTLNIKVWSLLELQLYCSVWYFH